MANIKSQKKRILTNEKARQRNVAVKSELKTAIRAVDKAVAAGEAEAAAAERARRSELLNASRGPIDRSPLSGQGLTPQAVPMASLSPFATGPVQAGVPSAPNA